MCLLIQIKNMELRPQRIICSFLGDKAISWIFQDIEVFLKRQKLQNYIDKKEGKHFLFTILVNL